ncbi:cysteine synthase family protein [Salmonella enterica]|nr:cysteine synthase family protein [Salmonella enterica]HDC1607989.1 cysteine synthase family protein [Salmonella enterica]HDC1608017.1 cysteine synthase family protein [Salmonella enterica]
MGMLVAEKSGDYSLLELVGNTPVVKIFSDIYPHADVRIKLESFNPGGSIKDRVASNIILDAENKGVITPGYELVEATSGNTGIGIAWIGRLKGYKVTIFTHDKVSKEKLALLKFYGANVIIMSSETSADSEEHYVNVARRYASQNGRFFCDQFYNLSNSQAHYLTTAPELWIQGGREADMIICGVGSGGTLVGINRYFRERGSHVKFIVADPKGSIYKSYFSGGKYNPSSWLVEGIGSNFIPGILNNEAADEVYSVSDNEAFSACEFVRHNYSLDTGLSSGAVMAVAIKILKIHPDKKIMCISPDAGERYISKFTE